MAHAQLLDAITDGLPSPNLPKQIGKTSYISIRDTQFLLTGNAELIESHCGGGQNIQPGLILTATQYTLVYQVPFVRQTDPGRTPNIPVWTNPFKEKALLCEHAKQLRQYNKCRNVDATLYN